MNQSNKLSSSRGLRVFLIGVLVLAGILLLNFLVGLIPENVTKIDISTNKMYSLTDTAKRSISKIKKDVEIDLLKAGGEKSLSGDTETLDIYLGKMASLSRHLSYRVVNTSDNPTYLASFGIEEQAADGSILVHCDGKSRLVPFSDIFYYYIDGYGQVNEQTLNLLLQVYGSSSFTYSREFDGTNQLLSAFDYVTSDVVPVIYLMSGHSEVGLSDSLKSRIDALNIDTNTLTLLQTGEIPKDCMMIIINSPRTDITENELPLLEEYLTDGGNLMIVTDPGVSSLTNLQTLTASFGMTAEDGVVIENNSGNYYFQSPHYLSPVISSHAVTNEFRSSLRAMLPSAHGIIVAETLPEGVTVSTLFASTDNSHIVPADAQSIDCPEGQEKKSHVVGAIAEKNGGSLVWITTSAFTNDTVNSYVADGNYTYLMSMISLLRPGATILSVESLKISSAPLVVPEISAKLWSVVMTLLIPGVILGGGLFYWLRRRKK